MRILVQIAIIFLFGAAGTFVSALLPFPFPASVISLLLLLIALLSGVLKEKAIEETSNFFLANIAFFFLPAMVKCIDYLEILSAVWFKAAIILIIAFFVTFIATALTVDAVVRIIDRRGTK